MRAHPTAPALFGWEYGYIRLCPRYLSANMGPADCVLIIWVIGQVHSTVPATFIGSRRTCPTVLALIKWEQGFFRVGLRQYLGPGGHVRMFPRHLGNRTGTSDCAHIIWVRKRAHLTVAASFVENTGTCVCACIILEIGKGHLNDPASFLWSRWAYLIVHASFGWEYEPIRWFPHYFYENKGKCICARIFWKIGQEYPNVPASFLRSRRAHATIFALFELKLGPIQLCPHHLGDSAGEFDSACVICKV